MFVTKSLKIAFLYSFENFKISCTMKYSILKNYLHTNGIHDTEDIIQLYIGIMLFLKRVVFVSARKSFFREILPM